MSELIYFRRNQLLETLNKYKKETGFSYAEIGRQIKINDTSVRGVFLGASSGKYAIYKTKYKQILKIPGIKECLATPGELAKYDSESRQRRRDIAIHARKTGKSKVPSLRRDNSACQKPSKYHDQSLYYSPTGAFYVGSRELKPRMRKSKISTIQKKREVFFKKNPHLFNVNLRSYQQAKDHIDQIENLYLGPRAKEIYKA